MTKKYSAELKQKVLRLYFENGRTKQSLSSEYALGQGTLNYWIKQYNKECLTNPQMKEQNDIYAENKKLRKLLAEAEKVALRVIACARAHERLK